VQLRYPALAPSVCGRGYACVCHSCRCVSFRAERSVVLRPWLCHKLATSQVLPALLLVALAHSATHPIAIVHVLRSVHQSREACDNLFGLAGSNTRRGASRAVGMINLLPSPLMRFTRAVVAVVVVRFTNVCPRDVVAVREERLCGSACVYSIHIYTLCGWTHWGR
jgi:hypothetical protein